MDWVEQFSKWVAITWDTSSERLDQRSPKLELLLELELTNSIAQIVEAFLSRKVLFICSDSAMN